MPRSTYTGRPATIADMRRVGIKAVIVECPRIYCRHEARMTFEELRLPEDTPMPDIALRRRFQCCKCGSRKVAIHTDWHDYVAVGDGTRLD